MEECTTAELIEKLSADVERCRLAHPRLPDDIDISGKEIANAIKAWTGYEKLLFDMDQ